MSSGTTNDQLAAVFGQLQKVAEKIPMAKVRELMIFAILLWFLAMLAELIWTFVPVDESAGQQQAGAAMMNRHMSKPSSAQAGKQNQAQTFNVNDMKSWHLFGSTDAVVVEEVEPEKVEDFDNISETRLNLELLGVMQSNEPKNGQAVIRHQSKADLYRVGDEIPGARNVRLSRVLVDRVILENRGQNEWLYLYDEKTGKAKKPKRRPKAASKRKAGKKKVVDHRSNSEIAELAAQYRQQLIENPMSLADVIKVSIAKDSSGNILGYRVRPGRHRKQFKDIGLKSGDIVTSINGVSLDDPSKAMELYSMMREATEASVIVKRGNEEINLLLGVSGN